MQETTTTTTRPDLLGLVSREISPEAIREAASQLGEDRDRTTSAVSAGIPSVLTALADVADSDTGAAHLKGAIEEVRHASPAYATSATALVEGPATTEQGRDARLLDDDLHRRSADLTQAVARASGVKPESAHRLMGGVASFTLLAFAKNFGALSTGALRSMLGSQRGEWAKRLPTSTAPARTVVERERTSHGPAIRAVEARRRSFLLPLLLLVAILIAIPLLRGARRAQHPMQPAAPQTETIPRSTAVGTPSVSLALPNGQRLSVPNNSPAYALATFLGSDGATPRRFTLAPLDFAAGSTVPTPSSLPTVNQVAQVLRAYPSAVVRVESRTTEAGTPEDNLALSNRRAGAIKGLLVERGVDPSRVEAVGLGQEDATRRTDLVVTRR